MVGIPLLHESLGMIHLCSAPECLYPSGSLFDLLIHLCRPPWPSQPTIIGDSEVRIVSTNLDQMIQIPARGCSPLQKQGLPEFQTPIPSIFPVSMKVFKCTPQLGFNLSPNLQGKLSLPLVAHLVDRRLILQSSDQNISRKCLSALSRSKQILGLAKFQIGSKTEDRY